MKRILAVVLFLMLFASAAFADGPGLPPTGNMAKPPQGRSRPNRIILAKLGQMR